MQDDEGHVFGLKKEKKECDYSPHDRLAEAFHAAISLAGVQLQPAVMLFIVIVIS